jgi:hypothetical protein
MPDNGVAHKSRVCCAWCGRPLLRKPMEDDHGLEYHVVCLARRRAILLPPRRPLAEATVDTPFVIRALGSGTACLACLVNTTGRPEPEIVSALRRLRADVNLAVGSCSRCGGEARLLCGLAAA